MHKLDKLPDAPHTRSPGTATVGGRTRQAHRPPPRRLLVLGAELPDEHIASELAASGWTLLRANNLAEARNIRDRHEVFTGLVLMPRPLTDEAFAPLRRIVTELENLEWLAVLAREDLAHPDVRRFAAAHLRDYQVYPIDLLRLTITLGHAWGLAALIDADRRAQISVSGGRFGMVGDSLPMRRLYAQIQRVAEADLPVLITGETGTGKELVARAIHAQSARAEAPFVALNCAAIPPSLVQSELFGFTKGAFTGASASNGGLVRSAEGGTLLLDEIGEMPLEAQASLLRFLEDKVVTPVGGRNGARVDVTIISSTNRDLHEEVRLGRFRKDLLYRLDVVAIRTPPLRDRTADFEALVSHFLMAASSSLPRRLHGLTHEALDWLKAQAWPGNVRELRSCVIQAALHCEGRQITAKDLARFRPMPLGSATSLNEVLTSTERSTLQQLLARNRGNVSKTARDLKVSRMTLYRLMAKHDLARQ